MASTVIGVILVVWTALAGWTAAQQQQPAALPTADEVYSYIARAVHRELQPVVSKLESRVESLDTRLTLLDSRMSTLTAHVLTNRLGVYLLLPSGDNKQPPVEAYCDMEFAGGNWTVIQRRDNIEPRQDFYLGWKEYKEGFGNVTQEFWWGLEHLFQLTSSDRRYELRVDLEAFDGSRRYATYQQFRISSELYGYRLSASDYSGNATDGLKYAVKRKFSTRDRDQDDWGDGHCAQDHQGAWWYSGCGWSNLNGRYRDGGDVDKTGIWWYRWRRFESLKKTAMKIRPT
ncbi:techylectin-5B-like [Amphibalanus amphitrite]|uniref:techylectin-5B-like n=1 Tax=Amphibalanus amphitrite TaxID=1232801 RepID=UPI001C91C769|nr:techylectin-5B-like [Amphibalanus amphitrite]